MYYSKSNTVAIVPPVFEKIEAKIEGGFARIVQRYQVIEADLVFNCYLDGKELVAGKDKVIISATSGLAPWSKNIYVIGDKSFCICPVDQIIGYKKDE